jgi:type VI secretion system protein ImpJ
MRQLQPVVWAKGTFLSPQYLQAHSQFQESLLQFRLETLAFRPWGFRTLQIDREALAGGQLAITAASGIFADGLIFDIPAADGAPPPKPLTEYFTDGRDTITVSLAIPAHRPAGMNVSDLNRKSDTRYIAETILLRDENTGQSERPVQVASKNFRLLVDEEVREGSPALPVARVKKLANEVLELDPAFVPPLLDVSASSYLMSILRRLQEILTAKTAALSGVRRQKNQSLADFSAADIANFWLLYTMNSHFPVIRHLFETRHGHPEEAFSALTSLAGSLTTFSNKVQPADLPVYDHSDLGSCFTDLDVKLRLLLETVVPSNFVSLPLKLVQPFIYGTAIPDDAYLVNTKLYLAITAQMPEANLISKTPDLIKVCSATHLEHLIRQALPGVPIRHVQNPPSAIPVKLNYQYFSLTQSGGAYEAIQRARTFAVYVPADFPEPQLELLILLPQAK